jgi:hypothetical protein
MLVTLGYVIGRGLLRTPVRGVRPGEGVLRLVWVFSAEVCFRLSPILCGCSLEPPINRPLVPPIGAVHAQPVDPLPHVPGLFLIGFS